MIKKIICIFAMLLLIVAGAWADDYNPQNPPDPNAYFKLTVSMSPSDAGYCSGGGRYKAGQQVWVTTSSRANYDFLYWTCDGERISDESSFYYTMPQKASNLVAVYAFNPSNPADPTTANAYRLYLENNLEGSCTFNLVSGAKQNANQYISVSAQNVSPGFQFLGWYLNDEKINENLSFWYKMPTNDATLTARFEYNPDSPDDPSSSQTDIDNTTFIIGDANGDKIVNIIDVVMTIDFILMKNPVDFNFTAANVNKDETINIIDVVGIIDIILGRWNPDAARRRAMDNTGNDQLQLIQNDDQLLSLTLDNQRQYIAGQFDLMLKNGQSLSGVRINKDRAPNYQISYQKIEPGFYRMLLFTLENDPIIGQDGELLRFKIEGGTDGAKIENAQLITSNHETINFATIVASSATNIREPKSAVPMAIYSIGGTLMKDRVTTTEGLSKGIYIINNKKAIIK